MDRIRENRVLRRGARPAPARPTWSLNAITFPAAAADPPIGVRCRVDGDRYARCCPLPSGAPAALTPMKLPLTTFPFAAASDIEIPSPVLPEMTLRALLVVPPTTLFAAAKIVNAETVGQSGESVGRRADEVAHDDVAR